MRTRFTCHSSLAVNDDSLVKVRRTILSSTHFDLPIPLFQKQGAMAVEFQLSDGEIVRLHGLRRLPWPSPDDTPTDTLPSHLAVRYVGQMAELVLKQEDWCSDYRYRVSETHRTE